MSSFRRQATSGILWSAVQTFGQQGIKFLVQIVLARLLMPEEFGLIAMVAVFLTISQVIAQGGFADALVQAPDIDEDDRRTAFTFNLLAGLTLAAILWFTAPSIARFYNQAELVEVLRVLCIGVFIGQLGGVHQALLTRTLQFKKTMTVQIPSMLLSGGVGIGMAYMGYGVWSLVAQSLTAAVLSQLLLWRLSKWSPRFGICRKSFKKLLPYGSRMAAAQLLGKGLDNIYVLVIGRFYAPAEVAFYQRARSLQQLPTQNIAHIFTRVSFPTFSRLQDDPDKLRKGFDRCLLALSLITFPLMMLLALIAEPLIVLLIKEKWLPAAPFLQALCINGALYGLSALNLNILKSKGRADLFLNLSILKKTCVVLGILITYRISVMAMVYGQVMIAILNTAINLYFTRKVVAIPFSEQFRSMWPAIFASIAVLVTVLPTTYASPEIPVVKVGLSLVVYGITLWLCLLIFRGRIQKDLGHLVEQYPRLRPLVAVTGLLKQQ